MQVSKMSSKGQITVPKLIREVLKLHEGDRVAFVFENGQIQINKADVKTLISNPKANEAEKQQKLRR